MCGGVQYVNYGKFNSYDEYGSSQGQFSASDNCFYISSSYAYMKNVTFGTTVKFINSYLGGYQSKGFAIDAGAVYHSSDSTFSASVLMRNKGLQFSNYTSGEKQPLPYEWQMGVSYKPKHMPARFFFNGLNLQEANTAFLNPNKPKKYSLDSGIEIIEKITNFQKIFTHFSAGVELNIGKVFFLRFGYNARVRREMILQDVKGFTALSWGFGIQVKRFGFSYGSGQIHPAQTINQFSLSVSLDKIKWKKKSKN